MDEQMPRTIVTLDDDAELLAYARQQPVGTLLREEDPAGNAVGLLLAQILKPLPGTRVDLVRADVE